MPFDSASTFSSRLTGAWSLIAIWGNFITNNNPSISAQIANGASSNSSSNNLSASNPATNWPPFAVYAPYQLNLNETGCTAFSTQAVGSKFPHPLCSRPWPAMLS